MDQVLVDKFGRKHDYLRISLLERCNLRCTYCMPEEGIELRDRMEFMSQEELCSIAETFVQLGIKKIRLTGGEPLIKKDFAEIINRLSKLPVELAITTNAVLLDKYFTELKQAGISKLNISLDSLIEDRFNAISRRTDFKRIRKNIDLAVEYGFNVKLNVVLMKGVNDDEIINFINLSKTQKINIRFIEFMPFNGNKWDWSKKVSFNEVKAIVAENYPQEEIIEEENPLNSTSKNFRINGYLGNFGIISTLTNPFCDSCNRIRLTADGKIKNCLFSSDELDLLTAFRTGKEIKPLIFESIEKKHAKSAGINSFEDNEGKNIFDQNRSMTVIGG